ncbi:MAG: type IV secretion protein IcmD [Legionellaceae bacterium]|nr:type IV secretion protein IcmD [Legionellaceae bacterium]
MKKLNSQTCLMVLACVTVICFTGGAFAASKETIGTMASTITQSFDSVGKLITASSYIAGLGFAISAILKFKQHKDNPQQTPIGQPIGLVFIAAALLFLPSILSVAGNTMFSGGGQTAGAGGMEIGS